LQRVDNFSLFVIKLSVDIMDHAHDNGHSMSIVVTVVVVKKIKSLLTLLFFVAAGLCKRRQQRSC